MKITIEVANDSVRGKAIRGSLYLDNDGQANFRPHKIGKRKSLLYKQLAHGRVSVDVEKTRLSIIVKHDEGVNAVATFSHECEEANNWLTNKSL